jgi:two-component system phosphate regulon sensor histidine kinase PhoR
MIDWILFGLGLAMAGVVAWQVIKPFFHTAGSLIQEENHSHQTLTTQIKELEQLRDGLLGAIDEILLVLDDKQCILFANPAAESLLGPDLIGAVLTNALPHPELDMLIQDSKIVPGEGMERQVELDKHVFHARAISSANGHHPFAILTLRDVTHIQRLERARREMVSNITHELSTPITAIGLLSDTLLNLTEQGKTKKTRKMAKDIRREVDTLTQLVQEMRDLSLIESGQMPVRLTPTNLQSVVQAGVEPLVALAENNTQTISLDIPPEIFVLADDRQFQRAIKNIVHNAVKFTPDGGHIRITATVSEDEAIIAVKDDGPGIPADDLPRIFERFYQVDRARREGTGLGLAIVRHIVMAHGGRAWAESVEGQGATFYIALALADDQARKPLPHANNNGGG